jgi:hypothetical protein
MISKPLTILPLVVAGFFPTLSLGAEALDAKNKEMVAQVVSLCSQAANNKFLKDQSENFACAKVAKEYYELIVDDRRLSPALKRNVEDIKASSMAASSAALLCAQGEESSCDKYAIMRATQDVLYKIERLKKEAR